MAYAGTIATSVGQIVPIVNVKIIITIVAFADPIVQGTGFDIAGFDIGLYWVYWITLFPSLAARGIKGQSDSGVKLSFVLIR